MLSRTDSPPMMPSALRSFAQHRDVVAQGEQLAEAVRDEDDRDPVGGQGAGHAEQRLDLARLQRRGGLVHDDHLGVHGDRPGQGDHLLGADAEAAQRAPDVGVEAEAAQDGAGVAVQPGGVDHPEPAAGLAAEQEVARDAHHRDEVDLLVDGGDPGPLRLQRGGEAGRCSVVAQFAAVGPVDAGEDLDEGGLAGAVLAHEGVHLAGPEGEMHVVERHHAGKRFVIPRASNMGSVRFTERVLGVGLVVFAIGDDHFLGDALAAEELRGGLEGERAEAGVRLDHRVQPAVDDGLDRAPGPVDGDDLDVPAARPPLSAVTAPSAISSFSA